MKQFWETTRQAATLAQLGVLMVKMKARSALAYMVGICCAIGVFVSMLSMGEGARRQALADARPDRVIVSSVGAQSPLDSSVSRAAASEIASLPGIRTDEEGRPIVLRESIAIIELRREDNDSRTNVPLYGVSNQLGAFRPEFHFTLGRMNQSGVHEVIASDICGALFRGVSLGNSILVSGGPWRVVGEFVQGKKESCTLYTDVESLMATLHRPEYNRVMVMLRSSSAYQEFRDALGRSRLPDLKVQPERQVILESIKDLTSLFNFASYFVGGILAIGATLGAMNSLYTIVERRRRVTAMFLAFGYRPLSIVFALVMEASLLALPAAVAGCALAWGLFDGISASPFGFTFRLSVTVTAVIEGLCWALAMGILAALLPAIRASRVSPAASLRGD